MPKFHYNVKSWETVTHKHQISTKSKIANDYLQQVKAVCVYKSAVYEHQGGKSKY